jgi:hypothetical protein
MGAAANTVSAGTELQNSLAAISARAADGCVSWAGVLLLVSARSVLLLGSQGLVALIFLARQNPAPWRAAGDFWSVYGSLVDIGCLIGLRHYTRKEGIRLRDLIGPIRMRRGRDFFLGLGYYLVIFPFFLGGAFLSRQAFRVFAHQDPARFLLHAHPMPIWAIIYSLAVWWILWSPTEETTYQAFALPRLEVLTGRRWLAVSIVGFWWAAQHCALPFIPDWHYVVFRFFAFLPGVLVAMAIYLRTRRLAPLIVAHWPMDIAAAVVTILY